MRVVIFDLDGTLLNSLNIYYGAVVTIFGHYGLQPPSLKDYRENILPDFMQFYLERGIPASATARDLNQIRKDYFRAHWREARLHNGAKGLLELCHELKLDVFLATSEVYEIGDQRLRECGIKHLIHGWARNGNSRYDDLADILAFLQCPPREAVYVDDSKSGLEAAKSKNLRLTTIGFSGGFNSHRAIMAAHPDFPKPNDSPLTTPSQVGEILADLQLRA